MKITVTIVRIVMGLLFLVSSLGYFFKFLPQPELSEPARTFITGLFASGYMMPIVKTLELICAVALLSNRYTTLALVIIFPITINIVLFHAFLAPEGVVVPLLLLFGNVFLAYTNRNQYSSLFVAR
jgi:putative oxidoreductase